MKNLDFIVIGAARSGTTSLWAHLRVHPEVFMPGAKELGLFSRDLGQDRRLARYMREHFSDAPAAARWGTATPQYMRGRPRTPVEDIVRRIHEALPDVRLIAILRDPVERAVSHWRYAVRNGRERRPLQRALAEELEPDALETSRRRPQKNNGYLTFGEYGRILRIYRPHFPPGQLLLLLTADLEADPEAVMSRAYAHIGADPGFVPPGLERRHHQVGERRRVSPEAEEELRRHLEEEAWSHLRGRRRRGAERAFEYWFRQWNMPADETAVELGDAGLRAALSAHYAEDAEALAADWGLDVPWRTPIASARTSS